MRAKEKEYPSRLAPRLMIRFPEGMKEQLAMLAEKNHRSMNAEIVSRLQESLYETTPHEGPYMIQEPGTAGYKIDEELQLINCFRRMPEKKRRALLEILVG